MTLTAYLLYLMAALILIWMWKRTRGMTLETIIETSAKEHHQLTALYATHPYGGSWSWYCAWLDSNSDKHQSEK